MRRTINKWAGPVFLLFINYFFLNVSVVAGACLVADSFSLPVMNKDLATHLQWDVTFNYFAKYSPKINGFHSGEDWLARGGNTSEVIGRPVRAVANGKIVNISNLGDAGSLIVIKHVSEKGKIFQIKGREKSENNTFYHYENEKVDSIHSAYIHVIPVSKELKCVEAGDIIGYVMDPGGGPHLHFEIRHLQPSNSNNWVSDGSSEYTGYYKKLQDLIDSGARDPRDFIRANKVVSDSDSNDDMDIQKAGLYSEHGELLEKSKFSIKPKKMSGLKINHYADGYYYLSSVNSNVTKKQNMTLYLVPDRNFFFAGADEMKGTAFEVKRDIFVFKVQSNGSFLAVEDGVIYAQTIDMNSKVIDEKMNVISYGLGKRRKQLIEINLKLDKGRYVFLESEGNALDEMTYPKKNKECWVIDVL